MEILGCKSIQESNDLSIWHTLSGIITSSTLPEQTVTCDRPIEPAFFEEYISQSEVNFKRAILLLNDKKNERIPKSVVVHAILLCGEHSSRDLWTNQTIMTLADQFLKEICLKCDCETVESLLLKYQVNSFLSILRPKLLRNSWKNYPAAISCFMWILFHVKCPNIGEILDITLPTCLLLVDDHVYSNKVKGLQCLHHIANNVSGAELNRYDRGVVIYKAVEHMIYLREPEIIPPLASCLIALLSKIELKPNFSSLKWNHFDDILNIWLPSMELEQQLVLRDSYISSLKEILEAMGLSCVRWSKMLLDIFSEYVESENTCNKSLKCLQTFIHVTWPCNPSNFHSIALILMKVTLTNIENNTFKSGSSSSTLKIVQRCFELLEKSAPAEFKTFVSEVKDQSELQDCYVFLSEINNCNNVT